MKEKFGLDISSADIDRTHEMAVPPKQSGKVRPVIVKFVRYNNRKNIYINKKLLKGTKVSITKSLTAHRVAKLKEPKEEIGFKYAWSNNGKKIYQDNGDGKTII